MKNKIRENNFNLFFFKIEWVNSSDDRNNWYLLSILYLLILLFHFLFYLIFNINDKIKQVVLIIDMTKYVIRR